MPANPVKAVRSTQELLWFCGCSLIEEDGKPRCDFSISVVIRFHINFFLRRLTA